MKMKLKRSMKVAITCAVVFALVMCSLFVSRPKIAEADATNVSNYKEAKAYLGSVRADYNAIMAEANSIYNQIEKITAQAFEAQAALADARIKFNTMAKNQYMNCVQFSIISLLLQSTNLDDFFKNLEYADSVMDFEYSIAKEQADKKVVFNKKLEELNSQTAAQNACLASASEKLAEAEAVLQGIRSKLTPEELAELEGEISDIGGGGDTPTPGPTPPEPTPPGPTPPGPQPTPPGPS